MDEDARHHHRKDVILTLRVKVGRHYFPRHPHPPHHPPHHHHHHHWWLFGEKE